MSAHNAVISVLAIDKGNAVVYFHCPCGANARIFVCDAGVHPIARFTAALRNAHRAGHWPKPDVDLGDATDAGWPTKEEIAA